MDNVKIHEPSGNNDHESIKYILKSKYSHKIQIKKYKINFHKGNCGITC